MSSFVILNRRTGRYLEWSPAQQCWTWLAPFSREATPLDAEDAQTLARQFLDGGEDVLIVPDYHRRQVTLTLCPTCSDVSDPESPDRLCRTHRVEAAMRSGEAA